jgi:WD40 repeat protein
LAVRAVRSPDIPLKFWAAKFSPDGKILATVGGQNDLRELPRLGELLLWNLKTSKWKRIVLQDSTIRAMAWAPNSSFIVMSDFDGITKLVHPSTGRIIKFLPPHSDLVNGVAISLDAKLIACASLDGTVSLWEAGGKPMDPLIVAKARFLDVAISADRHALVATAQEGRAYLFDLVKGAEPRVLAARWEQEKRSPGATVVAFAPDSSSFVTGSQRALRLWETASGRRIRDFDASTMDVTGVAFSPDGATLANVDYGGTLKLWDPATGAMLKSVGAHRGPSFSVSFSPNGKRVATAGRRDFTVKFWDAQTLELLATFNRTNVAEPEGP